MTRTHLALVAAAAALLPCLSCGAAPEPPPAPPAATMSRAPSAPDATPPEAPRLGGGSSDGTTCEEARDAHPDEIGIGAKRADGPEPSDAQFSEPLARGTYLSDCEVPEKTRVDVCAAITGGKAVGVTVATSPGDPGKEKCVAGKVREIPFPSHPRLRVVRTSF